MVENLRLYLESQEVQLLSSGGLYLPTGHEKTQFPLSLGRAFRDGKKWFNTGGPGYTLNKAALKILVTKANSAYLKRKTSAEDLELSEILQKLTNLSPIDTSDELGQERYHHFQVSATQNKCS